MDNDNFDNRPDSRQNDSENLDKLIDLLTARSNKVDDNIKDLTNSLNELELSFVTRLFEFKEAINKDMTSINKSIVELQTKAGLVSGIISIIISLVFGLFAKFISGYLFGSDK